MKQVFPDTELLSRGAAELIADRAVRSIKETGRFLLVLSGGHTPRRTYEHLAQPPFLDAIEWGRVHIFWGDERCVPSDDPRSNALMARIALLDHVPVPDSQIHPIACDREPASAALKYHDLLCSIFGGLATRFDLILLGLGEDGHTASLLPGSEVLNEKEKLAASVYAAEQGIYRVTLTPPAINAAAAVAFLVSGTSKASVLNRVLTGQGQDLPACLINPGDGELHWLLDRDAASLL
jgi:6-phosphogluconolactonase